MLSQFKTIFTFQIFFYFIVSYLFSTYYLNSKWHIGIAYTVKTYNFENPYQTL
jgi:hypothetical protein